MDIFPPAKQRPALLEFAQAIRSRSNSLRRDESRDWRITGKRGHIYAAPEGFLLYFSGTAKGWTSAKAALRFARVTQDGDQEGLLILDRPPTKAERDAIRDKLGIPKKRESSEEELARLRAAAPTISPFRPQNRRAHDLRQEDSRTISARKDDDFGELSRPGKPDD
jgi:hypothetical protein